MTRDEIWEIFYLLHDLDHLYTKQSDIRNWLVTSQKLLDDRVPIDMIADGKAQEVHQLVKQTIEGVYL